MHSLNHNQTIAAHIKLTICLLRSRKTSERGRISVELGRERRKYGQPKNYALLKKYS